VTRKKRFQLLTVLLGIGLLLDLVSRLGAEMLWFQEVSYLSVFLLKFRVRLVLFVVGTGLTGLYLLGNLALAQRLKYPPMAGYPNAAVREPALPPYHVERSRALPSPLPSTAALGFRSLLPLTIGLSVLMGLLLMYYGQLAIHYWQHDPTLSGSFESHPSVKPFWQTIAQLSGHLWLLGGALGLVVALLRYPRLGLSTIATILSILFGWLLSKQWAVVLQALHATSFNSTEPLFGRDISFYIFALPLGELVELWLLGLFLYGVIGVALTYLLSSDSLSQGSFPGFSLAQQRHLYGVGSGLMGAMALSCWLSRYQLLYSPRGVSFGASYTDVVAQLPAYTALSLVALAIALFLLWRTCRPSKTSPLRWVKLSFGLFGLLLLVSVVVPEVIQYLVVQPNELARERPFIARTIALTRQAFDLEVIDASNFNPQGQLTAADLTANELTVRNIRLWDQRPLLETNRQLQQIRPYYRFPDADIDRYTLQTDASARPPATPQQRPVPNAAAPTEQRQVLIAARELDYSAVPQEAKTWVNRHLIYTHGYGFTLSPVNTVAAGGLPEYFVKDITASEAGALTTSSPAIRASIPIGQPRIYYGEIANTYVMTPTLTQELDFPSGSDNTYNVYDGRGGINMGSWWRRGLFAVYLRDWQILFTRDFLPKTKVLFRRNIKHRLQAIAPFLHYDSDPYLVAANVSKPGEATDQSYLYWIVDAYTTSDHYPYADSGSEGINYIRNAVKVVIDAYHGSVDFYITDPSDPIIATWSSIFPGLFKPLKTMPVALQSHLRYPVDFFKLQSERLMTYHMTDPQVFYNREDQWQIPNEVYGSEARPVEPYYLITSLPAVPFEEFILLLPYTPRQRTNLIAWLAARSDGENYGKLLLYTFPKERLIYGPEQIEARINQDPVISQQISLWNRQGSRAIQGNLLIVPIEQSLLYVEPLYLEAAQNSLPTLVRVIVAYENRIVMSPTLEGALQAIFRPQVTPDATIIRPVEEPTTAAIEDK
jgi:uncharacterized protein